MKVTLKNGKDNVVDLEIVIPAKEAADAYNRAVSKIAQYVNIDGFRKGKAPRPIVEKHVGIERIKMEAIESMAPKMISRAIEENKLDVVAQPSITSYDFEVGKKTYQLRLNTRAVITLEKKLNKNPILVNAALFISGFTSLLTLILFFVCCCEF